MNGERVLAVAIDAERAAVGSSDDDLHRAFIGAVTDAVGRKSTRGRRRE
jgi:hypothetical protein